jgi:hypothetical protein
VHEGLARLVAALNGSFQEFANVIENHEAVRLVFAAEEFARQ